MNSKDTFYDHRLRTSQHPRPKLWILVKRLRWGWWSAYKYRGLHVLSILVGILPPKFVLDRITHMSWKLDRYKAVPHVRPTYWWWMPSDLVPTCFAHP